ncbi:hypothetical protein [Rhodococcus phenolicus]|uniref:hypothetical protein n=1 Tax=Rhodococcus phenolicus TaxID=263849 RepID=UPI00082E2E1C|nr:hypothetical protein [Rhodococcus phenolicus]
MDTATDEDRWVVPTRWWGTALPIRGLGPAPRERVSADAAARAARTYDDATEFVATALDNPDSDPALVTHGRAALTGAPNVLVHTRNRTLVSATELHPLGHYSCWICGSPDSGSPGQRNWSHR